MLFITTSEPFGSSEMVVPDTVIVFPGLKVRDPIKKAEPGFRVYVELPKTSCGLNLVDVLTSEDWELLITTSKALESRETVVPETVITPPGVKVWEAISKAEAESGKYVEPPKKIWGR